MVSQLIRILWDGDFDGFNASERALSRSESHLMGIVSMFGGCYVDFAEVHRCRDR